MSTSSEYLDLETSFDKNGIFSSITHHNEVGQVFFSKRVEICEREDVFCHASALEYRLALIKKKFAHLVIEYPPPKQCAANSNKGDIRNPFCLTQVLDVLRQTHKLIKESASSYKWVGLCLRTWEKQFGEEFKKYRVFRTKVAAAHWALFDDITYNGSIAEDSFYRSPFKLQKVIDSRGEILGEAKKLQDRFRVFLMQTESLYAHFDYARRLDGLLDLNYEYLCQISYEACSECYHQKLNGSTNYRCMHQAQSPIQKALRAVVQAHLYSPSPVFLLEDFRNLVACLQIMVNGVADAQHILITDYAEVLLPIKILLDAKIKEEEELELQRLVKLF